jgi:hypothetical protein
MRHLPHFLLIASLVLSGCVTSPTRPPPPIKPSLDQSLANECQLIGDVPTADDYDVLQGWVQEVLIPRYVDCAIRHRQTVAAWPK